MLQEGVSHQRKGWDTTAKFDGGLYRIRYTGRAVHLPIGLHARQGGIELTFSGALDPAVAADTSNYVVKVWSLKRSADYGSKHYGEHEVSVSKSEALPEGNGVFLEIPDLAPTWCVEIKYSLKSKTGQPIKGVIHNTIHALGD